MAEEISSMLSRIESILSSLRKDVDALKEDCKCDTGAKSPQGVSSSDLRTPMNVDDEVTTVFSWAERMELETG